MKDIEVDTSQVGATFLANAHSMLQVQERDVVGQN